jgi:hypothetical protein
VSAPAIAAEQVASRRLPLRHSPRLVRAEILKLRKRLSLVSLTALLTIGVIVVLYAVLAILHAANAGHHGPAGGIANLGHGLAVLGSLGSIAGVIVGATASTGDLGAGVFRELVVTGRSRRALYDARIPGALIFLVPFVVVAYCLVAVAAIVFAGSLRSPSTSLLLESGLWVLLHVVFWLLIALGLGALLGSRSATVVVLLAWTLAVAPILLSIAFLGRAREGLPNAAIQRFTPHQVTRYVPHEHVPMSTWVAAVTLVVWAVVALVLGSWRTQTRDA